MKTLIIIFSLSTIMFSCRQQRVEKTVFTKIDLSWGNGWTKYISVFIDSAKKVKVAIDELNKNPLYFNGQLTDTAFTKINHLINQALTLKFEKEIGNPIPDGSISYVIIESKLNNIESKIFESGIATKLDTIVNTIIQLNNYKLIKSLDSTFVFKSYNAIKPPPPIMETIQFIPPVIKDDVIEK